MAVYRNIQMTFWTDVELVDGFTPEDKYFYLYLLTNPHTNLCGCYEISMKQISDEMGYTKETIEKLIDRMERTHRKIVFSPETKEILIINWYKHNWTTSDKFMLSLQNTIEKIKNDGFKTYLTALAEGKQDTVSIPYRYPMDTTVTVYSNTITTVKSINKKSLTDSYMDQVEEILNYLNEKTGKKFTSRSKSSVKMIKDRLREGYVVDEFKAVIDNKVAAWGNNPDMKIYLRPETLFRPSHFDSYLNDVEDEKQKRKREEQEINERQRKAIKDADIGIFDSV